VRGVVAGPVFPSASDLFVIYGSFRPLVHVKLEEITGNRITEAFAADVSASYGAERKRARRRLNPPGPSETSPFRLKRCTMAPAFRIETNSGPGGGP
jgi:hypothetical protein